MIIIIVHVVQNSIVPLFVYFFCCLVRLEGGQIAKIYNQRSAWMEIIHDNLCEKRNLEFFVVFRVRNEDN